MTIHYLFRDLYYSMVTKTDKLFCTAEGKIGLSFSVLF